MFYSISPTYCPAFLPLHHRNIFNDIHIYFLILYFIFLVYIYSTSQICASLYLPHIVPHFSHCTKEIFSMKCVIYFLILTLWPIFLVLYYFYSTSRICASLYLPHIVPHFSHCTTDIFSMKVIFKLSYYILYF